MVTSATGIQSIRAAKADGLNVTCGTTVHHLCWTDEDLSDFNGDLKLAFPPCWKRTALPCAQR